MWRDFPISTKICIDSEKIGLEYKTKIDELDEIGVIEQFKEGKWHLIERGDSQYQSSCLVSCLQSLVLPLYNRALPDILQKTLP